MDPVGKSTGKYGGSIREAGGSMGAMGSAREEAYFRQQDEKKLQDLQEKLQAKSNSSVQKNNESNK